MTKAYLTAPRPVETHDGGGGIIPTCRPVGVPWEVHPCASPRCARPSGESPASSSRPSNPWEDELRFMDRWFSDLPVGPGRTWRREDLYDRRPRLPLRSERRRPDGRDHIQSLSVHFQSTCGSTFSPRGGPRTWVHVRGSPCPGTWGSLWRSTPDGGSHVELCDRHVETRGLKGIRIHWGVPTFHGAASQTSSKGVTKGMVERAGGPHAFGAGRPEGLPGMAWPGGRDNLQQPVEHRSARRVSGRSVSRSVGLRG
jgi:hypothetical protein